MPNIIQMSSVRLFHKIDQSKNVPLRKQCSNILKRIFFGLVFADGRVCISILHAPGDDPLGYELSAERWSPVQSVEKILLSVVSMLAGTRDRQL